MPKAPRPKYGLVHVATPRLRALLRELLLGNVAIPLSPSGLEQSGFGDLRGKLGLLSGLDVNGVRVALVVAIAERGPTR